MRRGASCARFGGFIYILQPNTNVNLLKVMSHWYYYAVNTISVWGGEKTTQCKNESILPTRELRRTTLLSCAAGISCTVLKLAEQRISAQLNAVHGILVIHLDFCIESFSPRIEVSYTLNDAIASFSIVPGENPARHSDIIGSFDINNIVSPLQQSF